MSSGFHILQNQLYCVAEQLVETIALVERRMEERRAKMNSADNAYARGYHAGYLNGMKFARSELKRIEKLDGVSDHLLEATANLAFGEISERTP